MKRVLVGRTAWSTVVLLALTVSVGFAQPAASPMASGAVDASPTAGALRDPRVHEIVVATVKNSLPVIAGLAIAVIRDGRIEFIHGYGIANLEQGIGVTAATRFEIGSITKQFTAACIVQLARAGKLSLDDPLGKYIPGYRIGRDVTLRQLLGQTSGVPEYLDIDGVVAKAAHPTTFAGLLSLVASKPLLFTPGTHWAYSNTNYILLGQIIATVSGQSYEQYVRQHVFEPAGMTHSGFIGDGTDVQDTALGYVFKENTTEKRLLDLAPALDESWASSASGIVSTVADLAAWNAALASGRIVSEADVTLLRSTGTLADHSSTGYGFGWIVDDVEGHPRLWHNGGTFGFHAVNAIFPNDHLEIIVLANEAGAPVESIANDIFLKLTPDAAERRAAAGMEEDAAVTARLRDWIEQIQDGHVARAQLTDGMSRAFTPAVIARTMEQFTAFGKLDRLVFTEGRLTQSGATYRYIAGFATTTLAITMIVDANGKIAALKLAPS